MKAAYAASLLFCTAGWAAPAGAQTIQGDGQIVEVQVGLNHGGLTTVCLESAPEITGRKRAEISHAGGSVSVSVVRDDHGPNCASFDPGDEDFTVKLEHTRLFVLPARLEELRYTPAEGRDRTITFRWVRE